MLPQKIIDAYGVLHRAVLEGTTDYNNSRPVLLYERRGRTVSLGLKEMLLLGAVSMLDCLISGKTGAGKTHLANLVMSSLFGGERTGAEGRMAADGAPEKSSPHEASPGYVNKTITPSMRPEQFLDFDASCLQPGDENSKTWKTSLYSTPILNVPGVVLNEANRAPAMIQNYLIPFLDRSMDIEGLHLKIGHPSGQTAASKYQYRIITINEGEEYAVEAMDRALRDRVGLEIPIDCFYQSPDDARNMFGRWRSPGQQAGGGTTSGCLEQALELRSAMHSIQTDPEVDSILLYLSGISYCKRLVRHHWPPILEVFDVWSGDFCEECHYAQPIPDTNTGNLCGATRAPTQRALRALLLASRALALAAHSSQRANASPAGTPCTVLPEDVWAIAPFVLQHKLQLTEAWQRSLFQGMRRQSGYSTWLATCQALKRIRQRYENLKKSRLLEGISADNLSAFLQHCEAGGDFWAVRMIPAVLEDEAAALLMDAHAKR